MIKYCFLRFPNRLKKYLLPLIIFTSLFIVARLLSESQILHKNAFVDNNLIKLKKSLLINLFGEENISDKKGKKLFNKLLLIYFPENVTKSPLQRDGWI